MVCVFEYLLVFWVSLLWYVIVTDENVMVGSIGVITGKSMWMITTLPDWLEQGVESSLRDTEEDVSSPAITVALSSAQMQQQGNKGTVSPIVLTAGSGLSPFGLGLQDGGSKSLWTDLDKFYRSGSEGSVESDESGGGKEESGGEDFGDEESSSGYKSSGLEGDSNEEGGNDRVEIDLK